jgi:hypothetical protein
MPVSNQIGLAAWDESAIVHNLCRYAIAYLFEQVP